MKNSYFSVHETSFTGIQPWPFTSSVPVIYCYVTTIKCSGIKNHHFISYKFYWIREFRWHTVGCVACSMMSGITAGKTQSSWEWSKKFFTQLAPLTEMTGLSRNYLWTVYTRPLQHSSLGVNRLLTWQLRSPSINTIDKAEATRFYNSLRITYSIHTGWNIHKPTQI